MIGQFRPVGLSERRTRRSARQTDPDKDAKPPVEDQRHCQRPGEDVFATPLAVDAGAEDFVAYHD